MADWVDETTARVARMLLVAEALGMRTAANMIEAIDSNRGNEKEAARQIRARAEIVERGEDGQ